MSLENPNTSIRAQQEAHSKMVIEQLAMDLHEAGREAVEKGLTQNPGGTFVEWADSPERTKEGRRAQARYIWLRYQLERIEKPDQRRILALDIAHPDDTGGYGSDLTPPAI